MLQIVTSYRRMPFQEKRMIQTKEEPHFRPDLGQLGPNVGSNLEKKMYEFSTNWHALFKVLFSHLFFL